MDCLDLRHYKSDWARYVPTGASSFCRHLRISYEGLTPDDIIDILLTICDQGWSLRSLHVYNASSCTRVIYRPFGRPVLRDADSDDYYELRDRPDYEGMDNLDYLLVQTHLTVESQNLLHERCRSLRRVMLSGSDSILFLAPHDGVLTQVGMVHSPEVTQTASSRESMELAKKLLHSLPSSVTHGQPAMPPVPPAPPAVVLPVQLEAPDFIPLDTTPSTPEVDISVSALPLPTPPPPVCEVMAAAALLSPSGSESADSSGTPPGDAKAQTARSAVTTRRSGVSEASTVSSRSRVQTKQAQEPRKYDPVRQTKLQTEARALKRAALKENVPPITCDGKGLGIGEDVKPMRSARPGSTLRPERAPFTLRATPRRPASVSPTSRGMGVRSASAAYMPSPRLPGSMSSRSLLEPKPSAPSRSGSEARLSTVAHLARDRSVPHLDHGNGPQAEIQAAASRMKRGCLMRAASPMSARFGTRDIALRLR